MPAKAIKILNNKTFYLGVYKQRLVLSRKLDAGLKKDMIWPKAIRLMLKKICEIGIKGS